MVANFEMFRERGVRRRRGAPRKNDLYALAAADFLYLDFHTWLTARRKRYGHLRGWSAIQNADWWIGSPSERAHRMVRERVPRFRYVTWERLRNMLSALNAAHANSRE